MPALETTSEITLPVLHFIVGGTEDPWRKRLARVTTLIDPFSAFMELPLKMEKTDFKQANNKEYPF